MLVPARNKSRMILSNYNEESCQERCKARPVGSTPSDPFAETPRSVIRFAFLLYIDPVNTATCAKILIVVLHISEGAVFPVSTPFTYRYCVRLTQTRVHSFLKEESFNIPLFCFLQRVLFQ